MSTFTAISVDDFLGRANTEIYATDITDRIKQLEIEIPDIQQASIRAELGAERDQLMAFRDDVQNCGGGRAFESVTIVPDELFPDHIRDWAEEAGMIDKDLVSFVDWAAVADQYRVDWEQMSFGADPVWVKL